MYILLCLLIVFFFFAWRRGIKERSSLQALVLAMLLDQQTYDNQKRQLNDFLNQDNSSSLDELYGHLIGVYERLALKNKTTFHAAAAHFLEERFNKKRQ